MGFDLMRLDDLALPPALALVLSTLTMVSWISFVDVGFVGVFTVGFGAIKIDVMCS